MKKIRRISPIALLIIALAVGGVGIAFAASISLTSGSSPNAGYHPNPMAGYTMSEVTWLYEGTDSNPTITSVSFTITNGNTVHQDVTHANTEVNVRLVTGTSTWFKCLDGASVLEPNRFTCAIDGAVTTAAANTFDVTAYSK